jgi:hypothetical protein
MLPLSDGRSWVADSFAENVFALHSDVCDVVNGIPALRESVSA